ncbi:uncharacterized protein [Asterias amurensis]|uniref:uncharacterized protein n=1 Tax=Asterias amurensis TaxID=7602 RepID=UPI003AB5D114
MAGLIRDVMNNSFEYPIDAQDIPRCYSFQSVHGKAVCKRCKRCTNSWRSDLAWMTFDLRNQRISKEWLQKCKRCGTENRLWFDHDDLETMVIHAVKRMLSLQDGSFQRRRRFGGDDRRRPPHEQRLCERCGYGNRRCWLGGNY